MITPEQLDQVLAAIVRGIDGARTYDHKVPKDTKPDDFAAYCVTQELRRAGFAIVQRSLTNPDDRIF